MADIAEIGFAYNPAGLKRAKADLDAIMPSAKKVEAAKLAVAKADLEAARASLAAAKATGSATKEQIAASTAAVRKATATLAAAKADQAAAGAASAVGAASAAAAGGLDKAGKAAQAAAGGIAAAGNASQGAVSKISRLGSAANDNLNAVQATPANIAAQFQDIGVTAAAGMNPLLIALQQGTQLSVAFSGGLKNIGAALKQVFSPMALLTIGVVALIAYLVQLGMEFFMAGDKAAKLSDDLDKVKFSSYALNDAQGILGSVLDLATGKINNQSDALMTLAKAQLKVAQIASRARAAEARSQIAASAEFRTEFGGGLGGGFSATRKQGPEAQIESNFRNGVIGADKAISDLQRLAETGKITEKRFAELAASYANFGVELANEKVFSDAERLLNGDKSGNDYLLKPDKPKKAREGGKTDGEKLIDVWSGAQAEIASENTRRMAAGLDVTNEAAATMAQRTKLLNELQTKGLPITEATRAKVEELAAAYGKAKAAADLAETMTKIIAGSDAEIAAIKAETELIGKYGRELAYAAAMAKLLAEAKAGKMTDAEIGAATPAFEAKAGQIADLSEAQRTEQFMEGLIQEADKRNKQLEVERNELGLTGAALAAYRYEQEMLTAAEAQHIQLSPERLAAIKETARLYGEQAEAINKARIALEFDRAVTRGFFTDLMQGARDGQGAWEAFKNAFNNVMDKIIDKLLNEVLDAIFQVNSAAASGGGGGGLLGMIGKLAGVAGGLLGGGGAGLPSASQVNASITAESLGGPINAFAKGDAFSNGATGFAYGRGGANMGVMGEAGPEAVMPLQRGPDGSLGVQMYGNDNSVSAPPQQGPVTFDMRGAVVTQDLLDQMNGIAAERADVAVQRNNAQNTRLAQRKFGK